MRKRLRPNERLPSVKGDGINRAKELACAAVGAVLGAAGCSPAMRSLTVPAVNAEERAPAIGDRLAVENTAHVEEAVITLISGTTRDVSGALFHLVPKVGLEH